MTIWYVDDEENFIGCFLNTYPTIIPLFSTQPLQNWFSVPLQGSTFFFLVCALLRYIGTVVRVVHVSMWVRQPACSTLGVVSALVEVIAQIFLYCPYRIEMLDFEHINIG